MKSFILCCLTVIFLITAYSSQALESITDYNQVFIPVYTKQGKLNIAIRLFNRNNTPYFLLVNPDALTTSIGKARRFYSRNPVTDSPTTPGYFYWKEISATPYVKTLWDTTGASYSEGNVGLAHALYPVQGFFLSVDMCPSNKPFEADFFKQLVKISDNTHQPFPVAIAMSGLWLIRHPQEFNWLLTQEKQHKLAITWVNHSFSHIYYADLSDQENFLLFSETDMNSEILATEQLLLEHDQLPSVFFRLPGLVADKNLLLTLRRYGLIPLGSDAWLFKNQTPTNGSIILVHGNSNEHGGIVKVMPYLADKNNSWLPISAAIVPTN